MLNDQAQREAATDPNQSFIVQAPAGSGKTEILTQRFLRLLHQVQAPEQIIALTFTRKAASEMRERIILALHQVANGAQPTSDHQRTTYHYAQLVLARDQTLGWRLLQQSNRLRIMTIDALCQMIAQAIPLHSNHYASLTDIPQGLYFEAARSYLRFASTAEEHQENLRHLLRHLDNRQDVLIRLFAQLLTQREQWLTPLFMARTQSKQTFEQALAAIEAHELSRFRQSLPQDLKSALHALVSLFMQHCGWDNPKYQSLQTWQDIDHITAEQATALATLVLTSNHSLRKSFDHHVGLKKDACPAAIYAQIKTESKALLETLEDLSDFVSALIAVSHLPSPTFSDQQWAVLQALFNSLPLLVAHLELQFQTTETIDFSGVAQQARLALGDDNAPTDLGLYWDYQIQHLLIDEFQDTSLQQFELLTQLLQGWEQNDGRTLFVVGDPMQSIYRFRGAEVGLFLRAQSHGLGPIQLQALQLSTNFRSTAGLVDWVNQQFQSIFPPREDIETGAVALHRAHPILDAHPHSFIQAYHYEDHNHEAQAIVDVIRQELEQYPDATIAILVRARSQLRAIITLLHQHHIPFQGVDIDLLTHLPHLRDVWSLTQALLMPANRLAWLAFLRSPWCGLHLSDVLVLSEHDKSIYVALSQWQQIPNLSEEGRGRARYLFAVLHDACQHRQQQSLVDSVRSVLQQLHTDHILSLAQEEEDLEQFWSLLRQYEIDSQIPDLKLFQEQFNRLYSKNVTPARLQIMTIHKSKGLEFDCVILPGMSAKPMQDDPALIRWLKLPRKNEKDLFLMSPIKAAENDSCRVYDYLGRLDAQKAFYESQRLLYVAVTRAKQRLYLFDNQSALRKKSFRHMLHQQFFLQQSSEAPSNPSNTHDSSQLWRLPLSYYQDLPEPLHASQHNTNLSLPSSLPRLLGIVTHAMLQWICTYHPAQAADIPWQIATDHLKIMGFAGQLLERALEQIQEQIHALIADPKGQWIIQRHSDEQNELEILTEAGQSTRIIDRTFTEKGVRWIIDFKTGQMEPRHQAQLNHYAELFQENPRLLIRCGLYYLSNLQWIEWEPTTCKI